MRGRCVDDERTMSRCIVNKEVKDG